MSQTQRYGNTAITLHWVVAALMMVNVALGLSADLVPDSVVRRVIDTHKSIGITVLGLALLRLLWRLGHRPPPLPDYPRWERLAAHLAHAGLYGVMFALPLTGWMHDSAWKDAAAHPMRLFGVVPWPRISWITAVEPVRREALHDLFGSWHTALGYVFYALFAAHLAGALKHQYVDRHPELQRMGLKV